MKSPHLNGSLRPESRDSGVALVLTLLIVSMLVVVVVGFVSVSRLEQVAARNATYQSAAEQMAQLATGQAVERLRTAVEAGVTAGAYATQSGRLYPVGQDQSQALFSQGGTNININALTSYGWVTGKAGDNISVGFPNASSVAGQVPGRTGFYIADETAKLPINFASPTRPTFNPVPPRPFSIKGIDTNLQSGAVTAFSNILSGTITNNNTISNWSYFFTPEQVALAIPDIGEVRSRRVTVVTETNPVLSGKTPWGTDKIRINQVPLTDGGVQQVVQALADPKLANVFGQTFADKYTPAGLQQVAANMLQLRTDHWRGGARFDGVDPVLGASQISGAVVAPPVGVLKKTNGIPPNYLGYTPFPMLSEIDVSFVFGWQAPAPDPTITIRVVLTCLLTNPFPVNFGGGGQFYAQIDKASFQMFYPNDPGAINVWRGPDGSIRSAAAPHNDLGYDNPWGQPQQVASWNLNPANGVVTTNLPVIGPNQSREISVHYDMSFADTNALAQIQKAYLIVDQVKLLSVAGDARSVKDWCSGNDFFNALSENGAGGPAQFAFTDVRGLPALAQPASPFGARGPLPLTAPPPPTKLVRADPRLKPALQSSQIHKSQPPGKAWNSVSFAAAAPGPSDFSNEQIPSDRGNAQSVLYNTNLPPVMFTPDGTYALAADFGKVFTGLPWRTLRMQPQPTNEVSAILIPDWALLDIVDFGPAGQALTMVNPNLTYASAAASPVVGFGAGLRSQLDVLTDTNQAGALTKLASPTSGAVATNVPGLDRAGTNQTGISSMLAAVSSLTNAGSWAAGAQGWKSRRDNLNFPPDMLLLPSEITEVNRFANYQTTDTNLFKANEYRLGALFPGLSTKSRFFMIYAVGEAFEGTNQVVAATALLQTLVEVDDSANPVSIRRIYQYPPTQ